MFKTSWYLGICPHPKPFSKWCLGQDATSLDLICPVTQTVAVKIVYLRTRTCRTVIRVGIFWHCISCWTQLGRFATVKWCCCYLYGKNKWETTAGLSSNDINPLCFSFYNSLVSYSKYWQRLVDWTIAVCRHCSTESLWTCFKHAQ